MNFIIFVLNICLYKRLWESCCPGSRGSQTLWDPSGPLFSWQKPPFLGWGRGKVLRRREKIVFGGRGSAGWKMFIQRSQSHCSSLIFALNPWLFSSCLHRDCFCLPHSSCCSLGLSGVQGRCSASGSLRGPVFSPLCLLLACYAACSLQRFVAFTHSFYTAPGRAQAGRPLKDVSDRKGGRWGKR